LEGYKLSCTAEQKQYDETSSLRRSEEAKKRKRRKQKGPMMKERTASLDNSLLHMLQTRD
jgi:hypothetical protein